MYSQLIQKLCKRLSLGFFLLSVACGESNLKPIECPLQVLSYGIVLYLNDSTATTEICNANVDVSAINYTELVTQASTTGGQCAYLLARERTGDYAVTINAFGYEEANTAVSVKMLNDCEVETAYINMRLSKR